ncbi:hypothetical protein OCK74_02675 [Chitinophagaceae bacterium LB-8]|uniref:Uncharacterized protein n=1 Tax=Paraflavisolibacter caeni TaxID=2982496 RepID=A0A9X2XTE4_9BACT|nr:hypothetical protein [Paraflavisolibacter caeni]MCU7547997.1 hypothetical protein [Paraflavisolibacter caeni]
MTKLYTFFLLCLPFFYSCKSASKAYEQGDYENAIERSIRKLQKDPGDREAKELLQSSYKFAVERHEEQIRILSNSSSDRKWEQMFNEYNSLQRLYNMIRQYPSSSAAVHARDYSSYIETYRDKAADAHYEKGLKWLDDGTKIGFREAYHEFRSALYFKPDDIDIQKQVQLSYESALVRVVVLPIDAINGNYYYNNSSFQMRNFQDQLIRNLNLRSNDNFVKFYSTLDTRSGAFRPDEVLEMRLGRINIGQPIDQQQSRQVSKEVVSKEIVYRKDSIVKEYTKVYATINVINRILVSNGDLFVTARDENGKIFWSDTFIGEHRWNTEFATYTGDERALSDNDKALINRKPNTPPAPEAIVENIFRQIEDNLSLRLKNYYLRYQ